MFAWQQTEASAGALERSGAHKADPIMVYILTYKHPKTKMKKHATDHRMDIFLS